jgi:tRNA-splicing ligase RtcB
MKDDINEDTMDIHFDPHRQRVPVWSWCRDAEPGARQQALDVAAHPAAFHHVALMPDAHQGFGMPIGGVAALRDMVSPNMVGVDIACGMLAARLDLDAERLSPKALAAIMATARADIPMGFAHRRDAACRAAAEALRNTHREALAEVVAGRDIVTAEAVADQLGTLGGGNHFLEIQADERGRPWLMLHSGSRNLGKRVCETYHRLAVDHCRRTRLTIPNTHLAALPDDSPEGRSYLALMDFCMNFSRRNREIMLAIMLRAIAQATGHAPAVAETINIHHNFAARETHYGETVWIHRKGATPARHGEPGIIPGSMGTPSHIVHGLGNPASFASCSHGAGRAMSRQAARRSLDIADFRQAMHGIVCRCQPSLIDESPMAYKDIAAVIAAQRDLVDVIHTLRPLAVEKAP